MAVKPARKKATKPARKAARPAKKPAAKRATRVSRAGKIAVAAIPKMQLDMPLDAAKVKAIQRCIAKGRLRITVGRVDLATGRVGDGWLYD